MNLGIRAILYSARKWKKTLLVFCLLLAITTLVLSGLAIADAQEEQAEELRGVTGTSFTVERNLSTGGWTSGNGGSYSTQEFISDEMLQDRHSVKEDEHERIDLHPLRGLLHPRPETFRAAGGPHRQVWPYAATLPEGTPARPLQQPDFERKAVLAPVGD